MEEEQKEEASEGVQLPVRNRKQEIVGHVTVDEEDVEKLSDCSIHGTWCTPTYFNVLVSTKGKTCPLSHFVDGHPPAGFVKDHMNRDTWDNRKCNLRNASFSQNIQNRDKAPDCTSKYIGVSWAENMKKWNAYGTFNKQTYRLGYADTELEAAKRHDKFILFHFGIHAKTNKTLTKAEIRTALVTPFVVETTLKRSEFGPGIYKRTTGYIAGWKDIDGIYRYGMSRTLEEAQRLQAVNQEIVVLQKYIKILSIPIVRNEQGVAVITTNRISGQQFQIKVDDRWYYQINQYCWSMPPGRGPSATIDGVLVYLPRYVLFLANRTKQGDETVDHIDQDFTDCREQSLRYLSKSGQSQNQRKRKNCSSEYRGVTKITTPAGAVFFAVGIKKDGKSIFIGHFNDEEKAARAYDDAVNLYHPGGKKNFPY
jgi:hypothetical protein